MNETSGLFHRIDFVFYRDEVTGATDRFLGSVAAQLLGEKEADKTTSGMWPSDLAGLGVTLWMAPSMS